MAIKPEASSGLEAAVARARLRAATTGELRPTFTGSTVAPVSEELADFVQTILTDGTYAEAVAGIGIDDPDLADI